MKKIQNKLLGLLFIGIALPSLLFAQDELEFEVHRVFPFISITKSELSKANTLIDLNSRYQSSWVKEYISVEVITNYKGSIKKAVTKNDVLSQEQKDNMNLADAGTEIKIVVRYLPKNNLRHNDIQRMDFKVWVDPEREAQFPTGQEKLKQYLEEQAIDQIPKTSFKQYQLAAVKFAIDEEGQVVNPHIFWTSEDEKIDTLLLQAISNMPRWKPATYADNTKTKQEFVLTVGDMESCVVNLLGIRRD